MPTREHEDGRHRSPRTRRGESDTQRAAGDPPEEAEPGRAPESVPAADTTSVGPGLGSELGPVDVVSSADARFEQVTSLDKAAGEPGSSLGWSALPAVLVSAGLALGAGLAFLDVVLGSWTDSGSPVWSGWLGSFGAGLVAGVLTAVLCRRVLASPWPAASIVGAVAGVAAVAGSFGPSWLVFGVVSYVVAAAGTAAILLTRAVRGLTVLVIEYAIALGVALAGAGAVSGVLGGAGLSMGVSGTAVVAAFALALLVATWIRGRLSEVEETIADRVFVALFILAVLVAASSMVVILASGGWAWARTAIGVTVLVAVSFALLGVGSVVRAWTPSGWWVSAPAAMGAGAVAVAVGAGGMRSFGAAVLGTAIGFAAGVGLTIAVAVLINILLRTNRARRQIWRASEEPGRLAPIS